MSEYTYSPLNSSTNSIRLLHVEPGTHGAEIQCSLFDSSPDHTQGPAYQALSYTWGGSQSTRSIRIGQSQFRVTQNLYSALERIRQPHLAITLWVDAICINQCNDEEKGHQVKQMGTIYREAEEVLVWLGSTDDASDSLFETITSIHNRASCLVTHGKTDDWASLCDQHKRELFSSSETRDFQHQRNALRQILQHPWFERVWILQEIANARAARILRGSNSCWARTFAVMPSLMDLEVDEHVQAVLDIMPGLRRDTWWSSKRYLHFLLTKFAHSQATVMRDKVYALLGISEDANDPRRFYPCYQKEQSQVIRDTLSFLLLGEIIDSRHSFPDFEFHELSQPIPELAARTLEWTLNQTGGSRAAAHKTARCVVDRINEGQLKTTDILLSLISTDDRQRDPWRTIIYSHNSKIILDLAEREKITTLMIKSDESILSTSLEFPREPLLDREDEANPNDFPGPYGETEDMTETILKLKESGASKEKLMEAYTWAGDRDGVQSQLEAGAEVDSVNENGLTALMLAAHRGHGEVVAILLEKGADVNKVA